MWVSRRVGTLVSNKCGQACSTQKSPFAPAHSGSSCSLSVRPLNRASDPFAQRVFRGACSENTALRRPTLPPSSPRSGSASPWTSPTSRPRGSAPQWSPSCQAASQANSSGHRRPSATQDDALLVSKLLAVAASGVKPRGLRLSDHSAPAVASISTEIDAGAQRSLGNRSLRAELADSGGSLDDELVAVDRAVPAQTGNRALASGQRDPGAGARPTRRLSAIRALLRAGVNTYSHAVRTLQRRAADLVGELSRLSRPTSRPSPSDASATQS